MCSRSVRSCSSSAVRPCGLGSRNPERSIPLSPARGGAMPLSRRPRPGLDHSVRRHDRRGALGCAHNGCRGSRHSWGTRSGGSRAGCRSNAVHVIEDQRDPAAHPALTLAAELTATLLQVLAVKAPLECPTRDVECSTSTSDSGRGWVARVPRVSREEDQSDRCRSPRIRGTSGSSRDYHPRPTCQGCAASPRWSRTWPPLRAGPLP